MKQISILLLRGRIFASRKGIASILIVFIFSEASIFAQTCDNKVDALFEKLEKVSSEIKTVKVDYVQVVSFESAKEKQKISGTLFFKNPCNIYINQKTPLEQRVYFDGRNITVYTVEFGQAVIDRWNNNSVNGNLTLATILGLIGFWKNLKEMRKTSVIDFIEENDECVSIKISPIVKKSYNNIKVCVSKATMYPKEIVLEYDGAKREVVFKNYIINLSLDKNIFKFNAPKDVEIIKLN